MFFETVKDNESIQTLWLLGNLSKAQIRLLSKKKIKKELNIGEVLQLIRDSEWDLKHQIILLLGLIRYYMFQIEKMDTKYSQLKQDIFRSVLLPTLERNNTSKFTTLNYEDLTLLTSKLYYLPFPDLEITLPEEETKHDWSIESIRLLEPRETVEIGRIEPDEFNWTLDYYGNVLEPTSPIDFGPILSSPTFEPISVPQTELETLPLLAIEEEAKDIEVPKKFRSNMDRSTILDQEAVFKVDESAIENFELKRKIKQACNALLFNIGLATPIEYYNNLFRDSIKKLKLEEVSPIGSTVSREYGMELPEYPSYSPEVARERVSFDTTRYPWNVDISEILGISI
ncbi:hypothetical protein K502DRAFT_324633 [Neoconidiobolus thromboides FSU 785]|nr:hypothetical protein K502DRAFT_324633 [Neoconidiobolus thromboides FSU 785]